MGRSSKAICLPVDRSFFYSRKSWQPEHFEYKIPDFDEALRHLGIQDL